MATPQQRRPLNKGNPSTKVTPQQRQPLNKGDPSTKATPQQRQPLNKGNPSTKATPQQRRPLNKGDPSTKATPQQRSQLHSPMVAYIIMYMSALRTSASILTSMSFSSSCKSWEVEFCSSTCSRLGLVSGGDGSLKPGATPPTSAGHSSGAGVIAVGSEGAVTSADVDATEGGRGAGFWGGSL